VVSRFSVPVSDKNIFLITTFAKEYYFCSDCLLKTYEIAKLLKSHCKNDLTLGA